MHFKHLCRLTAALLCGAFLAACIDGNDAYRIYPLAPGFAAPGAAPDCTQATLVPGATYGDAAFADPKARTPNPRIRCYLSDYRVPGAAQWRDVPGGRKIQQPDRYTLSFIEMPEKGSSLLAPRQLDDLLATFDKDEQDVVMIYVHGWRYDAAPGNGNAIRFRTMLGYGTVLHGHLARWA